MSEDRIGQAFDRLERNMHQMFRDLEAQVDRNQADLRERVGAVERAAVALAASIEALENEGGQQ